MNLSINFNRDVIIKIVNLFQQNFTTSIQSVSFSKRIEFYSDLVMGRFGSIPFVFGGSYMGRGILHPRIHVISVGGLGVMVPWSCVVNII